MYLNAECSRAAGNHSSVCLSMVRRAQTGGKHELTVTSARWIFLHLDAIVTEISTRLFLSNSPFFSQKFSNVEVKENSRSS